MSQVTEGLIDTSKEKDGKNTSIPLKINEQKVLYGLIAFPSRKDTEICQILGMRKSTFSTIKSRLEEHKLYHRIMMPGSSTILCVIHTDFGCLNQELFIFIGCFLP